MKKEIDELLDIYKEIKTHIDNVDPGNVSHVKFLVRVELNKLKIITKKLKDIAHGKTSSE